MGVMSVKRVKISDQTAKLYLVLMTAALALIGFVLEIGPVAAVFPSVLTALALELPTFGFLPYLALAASAAVGLHLFEEEPTPKEKPPATPGQPLPEGEAVGQQVRVRPELHQSRMFFTALVGYALLKGVNLALMWQPAQAAGINLLRAFSFGFVYVALGWFVMWQFLRWYARRRKWIRLQDELVGGDVTRIIAVVALINPVIFVVRDMVLQRLALSPPVITNLLLHLSLMAMAALLWYAHPVILRRTVAGLFAVGGAIILLTILQAILNGG